MKSSNVLCPYCSHGVVVDRADQIEKWKIAFKMGGKDLVASSMMEILKRPCIKCGRVIDTEDWKSVFPELFQFLYSME